MDYPVLRLKKGKEEALLRRHPWIFSGALDKAPQNLDAGTAVWISDRNGNILATGFYEAGSIAIKVLAFEKIYIDKVFFVNRLSEAWAMRHNLGYAVHEKDNAFRLVHSEGDELPGLVVDIYGHVAVMQCHSLGMYLFRQTIADAICEVSNGKVEAVYDKSAAVLPEGSSKGDAFIIGYADKVIIKEMGRLFEVDIEGGQKTGFFLDQREARLHLGKLAKGAKVLNMFSYTGGFSVHALSGCAHSVVSVDSSRNAIAMCERNAAINMLASNHISVCMDAKKYLSSMEPRQFDIIVLDPPAFAKQHSQRHKGLLGYKAINQMAISKIAPGGLIYTFSCSQAVDRAAFQSVVMAAAIEAGRKVQVLHHFSQPADHPVSIFHPEGAYLKGLLLRVV